MIPRWQWALIAAGLLLSVALAVISQPNSYAHLYLTGHCGGDQAPTACHPRGRR